MAEKYNEPNSPKEKQFDDKKKLGGQGETPIKKEFQAPDQGKKLQEPSKPEIETPGVDTKGVREKSYGDEGGGGMGSKESTDVNRDSGSGGKTLNT